MAVEFAQFTDEERKAVGMIVERGVRLLVSAGIRGVTRQDLEMDVSAVHAKVPLRLEEFAIADDFNFAHDLSGIYGKLNRQTGELTDCWHPRFARRVLSDWEIAQGVEL